MARISWLLLMACLLGCSEEYVVARGTVMAAKKAGIRGEWRIEVSLPSGQRAMVWNASELKVGDTLSVRVPQSKMVFPEDLGPR